MSTCHWCTPQQQQYWLQCGDDSGASTRRDGGDEGEDDADTDDDDADGGPSADAVRLLRAYARGRLPERRALAAEEDLQYCRDCLSEYHGARAILLSASPHLRQPLWLLEEARVLRQLRSLLEGTGGGDDCRGSDSGGDDIELVTAYSVMELQASLKLPFMEILQHAHLLLNKDTCSLFVQGLDRLQGVHHPFKLDSDDKLPGIYLLFTHPSEMVRKWALLTARELGRISRDDYYDLAEVIGCLLRVVDINPFINPDLYSAALEAAAEADGGGGGNSSLALMLLPHHLFDPTNHKSYWLGVCMLLSLLEEQAMESLLLGLDRKADLVQAIMHTLEMSPTDGTASSSSSAFWPALQCLMLLLDRLGSKVWGGHSMDPIQVFHKVTSSASYQHEVDAVRLAHCQRKIKHNPGDDDGLSCSQIVYQSDIMFCTKRLNPFTPAAPPSARSSPVAAPPGDDSVLSDMASLRHVLATEEGRLLRRHHSTFLWLLPFARSVMDLNEFGMGYVSEVMHYLLEKATPASSTATMPPAPSPWRRLHDDPDDPDDDPLAALFLLTLAAVVQLHYKRGYMHLVWCSSGRWLRAFVSAAAKAVAAASPAAPASASASADAARRACLQLVRTLLRDGCRLGLRAACQPFLDDINMCMRVAGGSGAGAGTSAGAWPLCLERRNRLLGCLTDVVAKLRVHLAQRTEMLLAPRPSSAKLQRRQQQQQERKLPNLKPWFPGKSTDETDGAAGADALGAGGLGPPQVPGRTGAWREGADEEGEEAGTRRTGGAGASVPAAGKRRAVERAPPAPPAPPAPLAPPGASWDGGDSYDIEMISSEGGNDDDGNSDDDDDVPLIQNKFLPRGGASAERECDDIILITDTDSTGEDTFTEALGSRRDGKRADEKVTSAAAEEQRGGCRPGEGGRTPPLGHQRDGRGMAPAVKSEPLEPLEPLDRRSLDPDNELDDGLDFSQYLDDNDDDDLNTQLYDFELDELRHSQSLVAKREEKGEGKRGDSEEVVDVEEVEGIKEEAVKVKKEEAKVKKEVRGVSPVAAPSDGAPFQTAAPTLGSHVRSPGAAVTAKVPKREAPATSGVVSHRPSGAARLPDRKRAADGGAGTANTGASRHEGPTAKISKYFDERRPASGAAKDRTVTPTVVPAEKPTAEKSTVEPAAKTPALLAEKPPATPAAKMPAATPAAKMPAAKPPATLAAKTPAAKTPAAKPPAMPAEKPSATPAEKPSATPAEKPSATPAEKPSATPAAEKPSATPAAKTPAAKPPAEKPPATPAVKPPAVPAAKPPAVPAEKPTVVPAASVVPVAKPTVVPVAPAMKPTVALAPRPSSKEDGRGKAAGGSPGRRVDGAGRGSSATPTLPPAAARRPGFKMTARTAPDLSQTSLARVQRLRCSGVAKAPRKAKLISPKPLAKLRGNTYMLACQETRRRAQQLCGGGGSTHGRGRAGGGAGAERAARVHREEEEDRAAGGVQPAPPLSAAAWRNDGGAGGGDELEDENFFRLSQSPPIPQQSQEEHYMSDRDEFRFSDDEAGEEATAERRSGLPAVLGDLPPGVHFKPGTFAAAVAAATAAKDNASGSASAASATDATSSSELVERGGAEPGWRWWGDDGERNDGDLLNLTQRDPVDMDVDEDDPDGDDVVPMEVDEALEGAGGADERRLGTAPPSNTGAGPRAQATARAFARPGPSRNALLTGDIAKAAVAQPPAPTGARVGAVPAQRPPSAAPGGGLSPLGGILSLIDDSWGRFCPAGALSAAGVLSEAAAAGMEVGGAAPAVRSAAVVETRALERSVARGRDPHGGVDFGAITEPLFFINQVLRWEVQALQRGVGGPPSGLCGSEPRFSVPLHFPSHEAYVQVFLPLLLLESWEQLASDMAEERRRNRPAFRMRLKYSSNRQGLSCGEFEQILPAAAAAASPPLGLGDVLILWLPTAGAGVGAGVGEVPYLGYVCRITQQGIGSAVTHDPARRGPHGAADVRFSVSVQTVGPLSALLEREVRCEAAGAVVTAERRYWALLALPRSPLAAALLAPRPAVFMTPLAEATGGLPRPGEEYNSGQLMAIAAVCNMVRGCNAGRQQQQHQQQQQPHICLVHGPPGTGKSSTIMGILCRLLLAEGQEQLALPPTSGLRAPRPMRILLCAPSNGTVDDLMKRIIVKFKDLVQNRAAPRGNCGDINLVRLGAEKSISQKVIKFSLDNQLQHRMRKQQADAQAGKIHLDKRIDETTRTLSRLRLELPRKLEQYQQQCKLLNDLARDREILNHTIKEMRSQKWIVQKKLIVESNIICCTLSTSGMQILETAMRGFRESSFACVIVDEAGQACEMDSLIPLMHHSSKLVLVGDPEQLPPTVLSKRAQELGYGQSLMERLYECVRGAATTASASLRGKGNWLGPVMLLSMQYRMHPDIAAFPASYVYRGELTTNRVTAERRCNGSTFQPYLVFDVADSQEEKQGDSYVNRVEARVAAHLISFMLSRPEDRWLGVITPYLAQKHLVAKMLADSLGGRARHVDVNTVEGFQGQERDYIVVTCVRAHGSSARGIGFLADRKRLNVALTRAKYSLIIVGHLRTLQVIDDWRSLISNAHSRGAIVSTTERDFKRDLHRVMKPSAVAASTHPQQQQPLLPLPALPALPALPLPPDEPRHERNVVVRRRCSADDARRLSTSSAPPSSILKASYGGTGTKQPLRSVRFNIPSTSAAAAGNQRIFLGLPLPPVVRERSERGGRGGGFTPP
ncbi:putative helicase senataxin isoform X2 [Lampetra planeri]